MNEFKIEQEITIGADTKTVFDHLTNDVSQWWDHSFSESPKSITLEPKVGGKFWEDFGDGNGALYCTIMQIEQNRKIVMQGPMGMPGAVLGSITFELSGEDNQTTLRLSHRAFGDVTDEHKQKYSKGWVALLEGRLKTLVENGAI